MKLSLSVIPTAVACLAAVLLPAPAQAAGERCATSSSVQRCAEVRGSAESILGDFSTNSSRPRVKVRILVVTLQRRTSDGWHVVDRTRPPNEGFFDGDNAFAEVSCANAPAGVYRSRGTVQWKVRGETPRHSATIASRGVRKGRLCD